MTVSRRDFIKWSAAAGTWVYVSGLTGSLRFLDRAYAAIPGGTLAPSGIPKYDTPLLIPPAMPRAGTRTICGKTGDYYEISMKQFQQQILPSGLPATTVWGYGAVAAESSEGLLIHHAPSLTIEAEWERPVLVKWINDLKDENGGYLPHLLPVDQTLHWANPPGGTTHRDMRPMFDQTPGPYTGPVPICTHVHGAIGVGDESDGYAEAWYLPDAQNIPPAYAENGTWYDFFAEKAKDKYGSTWGRGFAEFKYTNENRASTVWYHDHTLGMTRTNVYAGPAGFYLIRGGPHDIVLDKRSWNDAVLPGPAPKVGDDPSQKYYEIPIAIQDRAFNDDGSLFYPDSREFFDGATAQNPGFIPDTDLSPIWNPEFFGNTMMVNGNTWPSQTVEKRRYRFRFLNGCQSRFLILDFSQIPGVEVWQIGNEGGFLAQPVNLTALNNNRLLMALAERADIIVDFTKVPEGDYVLRNLGPDEPFGGGAPGTDFDPSDPDSTGQIMQFSVVPATSADNTTPPRYLGLPALVALPATTRTRRVALMEEASTVWDGPAEALLGIVQGNPALGPVPVVKKMWMDPVTENPKPYACEVWEMYNTTMDAHPMHVHEVAFQVVNRQKITFDETAMTVQLVPSTQRSREKWETGYKDTVVAYPGEVTRIKMLFPYPGQFVWHCHIVEHEDNEMMRPYRIGDVQPGQPGGM